MKNFRDRIDAGEQLAQKLRERGGYAGAVVLALPRGGVPVAAAVAAALQLPLHVFVVRKLGVPGFPELAMGAIASGGVRALNREVLQALRIKPETLEEVAAREQVELERREHAYRGDHPPPELTGRAAILVDDGIATGSTMFAAIGAVRQLGASNIVVATPVIPASTCARIQPLVDELVAVLAPETFAGVGEFYSDFSQTTDDEVRALLA
jgi:putative phosphoribosyl transferase